MSGAMADRVSRSLAAASIGRTPAASLMSLMLLVAACQPSPTPLPTTGSEVTPRSLPLDGPRVGADASSGASELDYAQLAARFNDRIRGLHRLHARVDIVMEWLEPADSPDDPPRQRREAGNGLLVFRPPLETALTFQTFGKTFLWAGSDARAFWVFTELHRAGHLFHGVHTLAEQPRANRALDISHAADPAPAPDARLPLPVPPHAVPFLLGLRPLDPQTPPARPPTLNDDGTVAVEPAGADVRLHLEPDTGRAVRVDLLDAAGATTLVSRLEGSVPIRGSYARLPESAVLTPVTSEARMHLEVRSANAFESRIQDRHFDLEALMARFRPEAVTEVANPNLSG